MNIAKNESTNAKIRPQDLTMEMDQDMNTKPISPRIRQDLAEENHRQTNSFLHKLKKNLVETQYQN